MPAIPHVPPAAWAAAERRGCYTPYFWDKYDTQQFCPWIGRALLKRPLLRDWLTVVSAHPVAYAEHRLRLAASSAVQLGSFAVVSVASDMRYHHWGMTASALAAAILLNAPGVAPRRYWIGWGVTALAIAAAVVARHSLTVLPWPTDAS